MRDKMCGFLGIFGVLKNFGKAKFNFLAGNVRNIIVGNLKTETEHTAQQRIRNLLARLAGPSLKTEGCIGTSSKPPIEFIQQTRFANARLCPNRNNLLMACFPDRRQGGLEKREPITATNHWR